LPTIISNIFSVGYLSFNTVTIEQSVITREKVTLQETPDDIEDHLEINLFKVLREKYTHTMKYEKIKR